MIQTQNLSKRHGPTIAVDDVNVAIAAGLTAIIGPTAPGSRAC